MIKKINLISFNLENIKKKVLENLKKKTKNNFNRKLVPR